MWFEGRDSTGCGGGSVHAIVVDELLRKVIDDAFDTAANTFCACSLAWSEFAANLVALTFGAFAGQRKVGENVGKRLTGTSFGDLWHRACLLSGRLQASVIGGALQWSRVHVAIGDAPACGLGEGFGEKKPKRFNAITFKIS